MSDCRFGVSPVNYPDPDPDLFRGWLGRVMVLGSFGASYYFGIWEGRGLLCLQQVRDGWAV